MQQTSPRPPWHRSTWFIFLRGLFNAQLAAAILLYFTTRLPNTIAGTYGWAATVVIPLVLGAVSAYFWQELDKRKFPPFLLSLLNTAIACALAFLFIHEGAICLIMASPLLLGLIALGSFATDRILRSRSGSAKVSIVPVLAVLFVSNFFARTSWRTSVTTEMLVHAPPAVVYPYIVAFPRIDHASDFWLCKAGLPYPVETVADRATVGAHRSCRFSGDIAIGEKITKLVPNHEIDFDVTQMPRYPEIADHATLERGRIALRDNGDGTTTLVGTSWYELHIAPAAYFGLWSDCLIHQVHGRVFEHIKELAEQRRNSAPAHDAQVVESMAKR